MAAGGYMQNPVYFPKLSLDAACGCFTIAHPYVRFEWAPHRTPTRIAEGKRHTVAVIMPTTVLTQLASG